MREKITSRQNSLVQKLVRLASRPKTRRDEGLYLCEGFKLLNEAVESKAPVREVLVAEGLELPGIGRNVRVAEISMELLEAISPTNTPQGVLFTCELPCAYSEIKPDGFYLLLDRLQDAGNVGTIIRTAEAFGIDAVLYLDGTADPFGPKAVRASMGALFRFPVKKIETSQLFGLNVYCADMNGLSVSEMEWEPCVVSIGQEGGGLSSELLELSKGRISVPMKGKTESLNAAVAAAVILWEMMK